LLSRSPRRIIIRKRSPRFHVVYQLTSLAKNLSVQLRVPVNGDQPEGPDRDGVYTSRTGASANSSICSASSSRVIPIRAAFSCPKGWKDHPLRKDFPLGYEEPQFTFNFDEIDLRKPYAKE
jgi:NADH-quinone oxidoreductase subunit C